MGKVSWLTDFLKIILFIYFIFGCARSLLLCGLSLVAGSRDYSSLQSVGFSLQWLLLWSTSSRGRGLQ